VNPTAVATPPQRAAGERPEGVTTGRSNARRLRAPQRQGLERFAATDPDPGTDISRNPLVAKVLRSRLYQFALIVPNQIIFWLVIVVGIFGTLNPARNFGTAITWYVWFFAVFLMMVAVGRAWCAMCPFGGFAEWLQRRTLWGRTTKSLGLGWKLPESWAGHGLLISTAVFVGLTWIEEYFNIAGPGAPIATSYMVLGIVSSAVLIFLLFERRTFCRYICPLSSLIGTVGAMGSVAGFRTRDRERCLTCATKDCMRGGTEGYGCPWYNWPGSADSNLMCGLCSECYKACPHDNVGLYVQKPGTSIVSRLRRRPDVAWSVAILSGLPIYQQFNALGLFGTIDDWLNAKTGFPHYPNPIDFIAGVALVALAIAGAATALRFVFARRAKLSNVLASSWHAWFVPLAYSLIPVMGADFLARQLPKFLHYAPRMVPAVAGPFGIHTSPGFFELHLLSDSGIVATQVAVVAIGMLAALAAAWRISRNEIEPLSDHPALLRVAVSLPAIVFGAGAIVMYVLMKAAD
jgi:NosR/NirI family nitrous oxide reductase transcriptional regulator